jgi:hypothetical protein
MPSQSKQVQLMGLESVVEAAAQSVVIEVEG